MAARLLMCIILLVFSAHARGEKDDICAFLDGISPSQIYSDDKGLEEAFGRELAWIKAAHERRRNIPHPATTKRFKSEQDGEILSPESADDIHPPEFVEEVRSLAREDYQIEFRERIEGGTPLDVFLHPHKMNRFKGIKYKGKPQPYTPSTASDTFFTSLYIFAPRGILTEAGILVAAAAEFWLYGVPRESLESYEADGNPYLSRLGFIDHDEFHRWITVYDFVDKLGNIRGRAKLPELSPLPKRIRNLLSNLKLNKQLVNDIFDVVHEREWVYLDNQFFKKNSFLKTPWVYELYTYFFEIPVNPAVFSITINENRNTMIFYVLMDHFAIKEKRKGKEEKFCHCLSDELIFWCCLKNSSVVIDLKRSALVFPYWKYFPKEPFLKSLDLVMRHPAALSDDNAYFKTAVLLLEAFEACDGAVEAATLLESLEKTYTTEPITNLTRVVAPATLTYMKGGVLGYFLQSLTLLDMTWSDDVLRYSAGTLATAFNICNPDDCPNLYGILRDINDRSRLTMLLDMRSNPDVVNWLAQNSPESEDPKFMDFLNTCRVLPLECYIISRGARLKPLYSTPLGGAAQSGHLLRVKFLLMALKVPVNQVDKYGDSALHKMVSHAYSDMQKRTHKQIIEFLIQQGGNLHLPNNDGDTPVVRAAKAGNLEFVQIVLPLMTQHPSPASQSVGSIFSSMGFDMERYSLETILNFLTTHHCYNDVQEATFSSGTTQTLVDICALLPNLRSLWISHYDFIVSGLGVIVSCPFFMPLSSLTLSENNIGAEGYQPLTVLTNLQSLKLYNNKSEHEGCPGIPILTGLRSLAITDNKIGDVDCQPLTALTGLQSLDLGDNNIGDVGCQYFTALTNLQSLDLGDNNIGDVGCQYFTILTNLHSLDLRYNSIGDVGCQYFTILTNLHSLDLRYNSIGDAACRRITATLTDIQSLSLSDQKGVPAA